jgi:4-hydroxy-3-methylbut-2-enyl diphosphate reductase
MDVYLAYPRGFCAGVDRAIQIVEKSIERYGAPVFVRHEIVHNRHVVDSLREQGAVFVEELNEVPDDSTVIFSAHGVAREVYEEVEKRHLRVIDATCPLVKKVHHSALKHYKDNAEVVLIGHAGHAEVVGTLGQLPPGEMHLVGSVEDVDALQIDPDRSLSYITQTTLSVEETRDIIDRLRVRFPEIRGPEKGDLCYATTNRQLAVRELCQKVQLLLVVGAANSSNSNRLRELGEECGCTSYLIADEKSIDPAWFSNVGAVGISSGASAPEILVSQVVNWLKENVSVGEVIPLHVMDENVHFPLPRELREEN